MNAPNRPSAKEIAERIHASRRSVSLKQVEKTATLVGYVRGSTAAAAYCGIDRKTFRRWRDDNTPPGHLKKLLQPRIIRGESYYKLSNIDRFMDPANNAPGEIIRGGHLLAA